MLREITSQAPAREQLRDLLGDEVVDRLTDRQCGRVLGAVFATAQRELMRFSYPGQLQLPPAA